MKKLLAVMFCMLLLAAVHAEPVITGNFVITGYINAKNRTMAPGLRDVEVMEITFDNPNAPSTINYRIAGVTVTAGAAINETFERIIIKQDGSVAGEAVWLNTQTVFIPLNIIVAASQKAAFCICVDLKNDAVPGKASLSILDAADIRVERESDSSYIVMPEPAGLPFPYESGDINVASDKIGESFFSFPNPARAGAEPAIIQYYLKSSAEVSLSIFDLLGRKVKEIFPEENQEGNRLYKWEWNALTDAGKEVIAGLYYAVLTVNGEKYGAKVVIIK